MDIEALRRLISDKDPTPNKFTIRMGELIRVAREEKGISQSELAKRVYRRQGTISDWENGKTEVGTGALILLAAVLDKPITYFFQKPILINLVNEKQTALEEELLLHFRRIWDDELQKVAINQIKILGEFDPEEMIINSLDIIAERIEMKEELKSTLEKSNKK
jgi:transcriptional regulator with XRE-family HTH domain